MHTFQDHRRERERNPSRQDAPGAANQSTGLGWFSIALGTAELLAPQGVARLVGLPPDERTTSTLRALGAREIGTGLAILREPDRQAWMWTRVGGDAMDLSFLAGALGRDGADRGRLLLAIASVAGVTALDLVVASQLRGADEARSAHGGRTARRSRTQVRVERVETVNRPVDEVYRFWRDFENLPRFMRHLESVQVTGGKLSRWRATAPGGTTVEWQAEIVMERENEWIAWKSMEGSQIENSGSVRFSSAPGRRGTEVRVQLQYSPPAGRIGRGIATLFGEEPEQQITEDLRRFKQLMETGEIPVSEGPGLWRPARPPARAEELKDLVGVRS